MVVPPSPMDCVDTALNMVDRWLHYGFSLAEALYIVQCEHGIDAKKLRYFYKQRLV